MRLRFVRRSSSVVGLLIILSLFPAMGNPSPVAHQAQAVSASSSHGSSVMFIENMGQFADGARFQVRGGPAGTMWLMEDAIWITVMEQTSPPTPPLKREGSEPAPSLPGKGDRGLGQGANIRLSFPGANPHPRLEPFDRLDTVISYFLGNDPEKWRPDVPAWGGVRYVDLYPGIDLEITSEGGQTVQRLATRPGADLSAIRLRVEGADSAVLDGGYMRLSTAAGEAAWPLLTFERENVERANVERINAQTFDVAEPFAPGRVHPQSPISNPQSSADNPADLLYSTFLGDRGGDQGCAIAVDGTGSAYVTGYTNSADFPTTPGAFDPSFNGGYDAFVVKLNPDGGSLAYATFFGGSGGDIVGAIAVDGAGRAYVTGYTGSDDFPTTPDAFDSNMDGEDDAFVIKLDSTGSGLTYATFLGGSDRDVGVAIAVDGAGSIYVTGYTASTDFPTMPGAFDTDHNGNWDAFVVKLDPAGSGLAYATFLGGSGAQGHAIAVDRAGSAYVMGVTGSPDFPTTPGAFDTSYNGNGDTFVVKLDSTGSRLVYATFLGGSAEEYDSPLTIAVDGTGSAYVTGCTDSDDFPTTPGAFDTSYNGGPNEGYMCGDVFVVKLNPAGSDLIYATYLGGSGRDAGGGIAVDGSGSAYIAGCTKSGDFPATPGAFDTSYNGDAYPGDAFVVKLDPAGSRLIYATFLGGSSADGGVIAVDAAGRAYVTGSTASDDFPTTPGAFDTNYNDNYEWDAFVAKLAIGSNSTSTWSSNVLVNDDIGMAPQMQPNIAVGDNGQVVVVWADSRNGNWDIYGQRYTRNGNKLGSNFRINDDNSGYAQTDPAVCVDGSSNSVIVWSDQRDGGPPSLYAQRYDSQGNRLGGNFLVAQWNVYGIDIACRGNGDFTIAWTGDNFVVYAKRYHADGTPIEDSFRVDDNTGSIRVYNPQIAIGGNGEFVIIWQDTRNGGYPDIYAQRFDSSRNPLGGNQKVNDDTASASHSFPAVALDPVGNAYVVWEDFRRYGALDDVYFDYSSTGSSNWGGDQMANDYWGTVWGGTSIGVDASEHVVVVWREARVNGLILSDISQDKGASWGADVSVNDAGETVNQSAPTLAVNAQGDAYAAWVDNRNGNDDIYFAYRLVGEGPEPDYSISGRVIDDGGNAISGVAISDGSGHSTTTDAVGNYTLSSLPAATYTLTPTKGAYIFSPTSRTVTVPPDATGQDFIAQRLPADPTRSTISAQPASVPADGASSIIITVQLLSADGEPAWGKTVRLSSSRGPSDVVAQPAAVTDSQGVARGAVRSSTTGTATISAFVYDDGIALGDTVAISFESYTPPSGAFLYRLNQVVDTGIESFEQIKDDAQTIADDGNYFRGAVGADAARLATDIVFDMADVIGGVNQTWQLQKAARLACPGCYVPGTWNVEFSYNYPAATRLLDIGFMRLEDAPASAIAEFIGWGGPQLYGKVLNAGASYVTKEVAKNATRTIFASMNDGMTSVAYPAVRDTADELTALLDIQRDNLLANLPAMTPAYQSAYEGDLTGRTLALLTLGEQLDDERMTLANLRQVQGQQPNALLNFLLRFIAKGLATGSFDGPGALAVGGTLTLFDGYMDGKRLGESMQMYDLATGALLGAPDALRQTYRVANKAMDRIATGQPADRATGQITGVTHHNSGSGWGPFWHESASWSEVSLINTGASEATFRVLTSYLADTTRFGLPWATMNLVEEPTITLAPGASGTVRVDYKRANGTKGFSPRSKTCVPCAGCVQASDINIQVLGTNEAGTYYIANDLSVWQPTRVILAGVSLAGLAEDLPVIDPPLTSYVLSAPWTQKHEVQLWINNPFTNTVPVTVTQVLPADIVLLDPGGAIQVDNVLTWTTSVEASALKVVTCTLSFPAAPGTPNTLTPATLSLISPLDGQPLTSDSNPVDFQAVWPLTLDHVTPGYVLPGASSSAVVSITNWLSSNSVMGTLTISITDVLSTTVYADIQPFSVPIGATGVVNFALPATLAPGNYQVVGVVATGGVAATAFTDLLQVGLPGPWLDYRASPAGPVHANETITYTARFTNTTGVPLTSAVVTASLPASVTLVAGSITGGGVEEAGQVRWTPGTIATDQSVEQHFVVRVNPDAVPADGEPGRLLSEPRLTAAETAPAWGPVAWNLTVLPAVVPTVTVSRSGSDIVLTWPHNPANIGGYEVWWSTDPYFTPGEAGTGHVAVQPVEGSGSYTHIADGGAISYFYVVLSVDGAKAKSAASNRVGMFNFALVPGSP